jgi:hypothetical protein
LTLSKFDGEMRDIMGCGLIATSTVVLLGKAGQVGGVPNRPGSIRA